MTHEELCKKYPMIFDTMIVRGLFLTNDANALLKRVGYRSEFVDAQQKEEKIAYVLALIHNNYTPLECAYLFGIEENE